MPPLKGRALVDELCFKLPTYLQEQLGVTQIQVDARAGCTAADLDGFERNTGYALPEDLRAFLAVSNGLKCDWAVDVKTRGPADVGALRLHRLDDIVPVTLDDDEADDAGARARDVPARRRRGPRPRRARVRARPVGAHRPRARRCPYFFQHVASDDESVDSPSRGAPPFRRAGTVTSVSFPSRGPLSSYGSLDASLRPRRHTRSHRVCLVYRARPPRRARGLVPGPRLRLALPRALVHVRFRLAVAHLGVRGWRGALRALRRGPRSRASGWRLYCPERPRTTARRKPPRREDKYRAATRGARGTPRGV